MAELTQLEQVMRQPDAVMEPAILEKLRQYVAKGGSPRDVVEMLTDSYVGEAPCPKSTLRWRVQTFSSNMDQNILHSLATSLDIILAKTGDAQ